MREFGEEEEKKIDQSSSGGLTWKRSGGLCSGVRDVHHRGWW